MIYLFNFPQCVPKAESLCALLGDDLPPIEINTQINENQQQEDFFAPQIMAKNAVPDFFADSNSVNASQEDFFQNPQFEAFQSQQKQTQNQTTQDILSLFDTPKRICSFYFASLSFKNCE